MKLTESTVFIVDDDEEIITQTRKILENMGAQVLSAHAVPDALKILEEKKPHLIITDIEMTPLTGFDFLKKLKEDRSLSAIPAVVLSSLNNKEAVYKAISLGALDYIVKPLKAVHFIRKIRRVLKDQDFLKYDFTPEESPSMSVSVGGNLQSVGDIGIRVESGACFNLCKNVTLREIRPEVAHIEKIKFSIHSKGQRSLKGMYVNELIAVPVGPEFLQIKKGLNK